MNCTKRTDFLKLVFNPDFIKIGQFCAIHILYLGVGGTMSKTCIPVHRGVPVTKMIMILRTSLLKRFYNLDISWFSLFYLVTMNSRNKIKVLTMKNLIFKIILF